MKPSSSIRTRDPALILIVDDAPENLMLLELALEGLSARVVQAQSGAEAIALAAAETPDLVLLDIVMPGMDGYETCTKLRSSPATANTPIIFLSALDDWDQRVKGLEAGAVDYIVKPFHPADVLARVKNHLEIQFLRAELASQNRELARELSTARELLRAAEQRAAGPLVGSSRSVQLLRQDISRMSTHLGPVMLFGPRGAGAEGVARAIHRRSSRAERRFIHVDCRVLGGQESVIFDTDPAGIRSKLDQAHRGSLFLEDLQALSPPALDGLQHVLSTMMSAGDDPAVRVIAGVDAEAFAQLPASLAEIFAASTVSIPSLKQRLDDLPQLVEHYLRRLSVALGRPLDGVTERTMELLQRHHWAGNLAELESLLHTAAFVSEGSVVVVDQRMLRPTQLGAYELIERLQSGAMGEVWRARHRLLARPAAVKLIRQELSSDSKSRALAVTLFRREAQATAELTSPNTVRLFDFGVSDDGTFYYVMELLDGLELRQLVERCGPVAPERVVFLVSQACGSLAEAHSRGLIHRDIKPSNLFVTHAGAEYDVLRVLDFGVVKPVEAASDVAHPEPSLTASAGDGAAADSDVRGTPAYMAPDALTQPGGVDHRTDIYSLGCVLFFMLTGRPPFDDKSGTRVLMKQISEVPKAPSVYAPDAGITPELDALVMECLAKKPGDRPPTAEALRGRLEGLALAGTWSRLEARRWWRDHPAPGEPVRSSGETSPGWSEAIGSAATQTLDG